MTPVFLIHALAIAALLAGGFSRNAAAGAVCIVLAFAYAVGLAMFWAVAGPAPAAIYQLSAPLVGGIFLLSAVSAAPFFALPALAAGVTVAALAARPFVRGGRVRVAAALGVIVFAFASWAAAEVLFEAAMRVRAGQQFPHGYCFVTRQLVPVSLLGRAAGPRVWRDPHARIVDERATYAWSFRALGFDELRNPYFAATAETRAACAALRP